MWYGYSRRASSLSQELNAELILIETYVTKNPKFRKYFLWIDYIFKSIITLVKLILKKPEIIIATSPPSFCPIVCYFYSKLFNKKLIIDAHNSAFLSPWIKVPLYKRVLSKAEKVLVHNLELLQYLNEKYNEYNFHLLPDPLPKFNIPAESYGHPYFLIICSFSDDEPIEIILKAVEEFLLISNKKIQFYVTGNYFKKLEVYKEFDKNENIKFLGFVDEKVYEKYLSNAFGIITISTKKMVQQSAAIEALAAEVPFLTEKSETNKRIFNKGVVLSEIDKNELIKALEYLTQNQLLLKKEITELKQEYEIDWKQYKDLFLSIN